MKHTLSLTDELMDQITSAIFSKPQLEGAAYLLCGVSLSSNETRLLGRKVVPVVEEHYRVRSNVALSIASESFVRVAKDAKRDREAVLFIHSHPESHPDYSAKDDVEEPRLITFFHARVGPLPHGSLVFNSPTAWKGRILGGNLWQPIERTRIIGRRFKIIDNRAGDDPIPEFFDRQVRAFGPDIQLLLKRLHVGVVGAGGTGSATIEQLARLGVGKLSVFDGEAFEKSNVNRVYGSAISDEHKPKVQIQDNHIKCIGLGTEVISSNSHITQQEVARRLRECDIVFGCTDKQAPRAILGRLALRYLIPVFDMAVKIDSEDQTIKGIWGRVTTLLPGEACLLCRKRIDPEIIRAEGLPPEQRDREIEEGYIRGFQTNQPAVIMFTCAVASQAICEMLHRFTGFMGNDRQSSETLLLLNNSRIRTNRVAPDPDCSCRVREHWGRGDTRLFLGQTW